MFNLGMRAMLRLADVYAGYLTRKETAMRKLFALINPFIVALARSPLHWLISRNVMVIQFSGKKSGKRYAIPVSYLRQGNTVYSMTLADGLWWRNLFEAALPVQVVLRGQEYVVHSSVEANARDIREHWMANFCGASRISAFFSGVGFRNGVMIQSDLRQAASQNVLISLELA